METKKVLINSCFGGLSFSKEAFAMLLIEWTGYEGPEKVEERYPNFRENSTVLEVIESLGSSKASGRHACFEIIEIPIDIDYTIEDYDGWEWIAEVHRTWGT